MNSVNIVTRISGDQTSHTTDRSGQKVPVYVPLDCEPSHTPLAVSASAFRLGRSSGMFPHGRRAKTTSSVTGPHDHPVRNTLRCALRSVTRYYPGARASQGDSVVRSGDVRSVLWCCSGGIKRQTPSTGSLLTAGPRVPPSRTPPSVQD